MSASLLLSPTRVAAMVAASAVPVPVSLLPGRLKPPQMAFSKQPDKCYKLLAATTSEGPPPYATAG